MKILNFDYTKIGIYMFIYGSAIFSADSIYILSGKHPTEGKYLTLTNSLLLSANVSFLLGSVFFLFGYEDEDVEEPKELIV